MSEQVVRHVDAAQVAAVRAFTRFYTARLEVLEEGLLHTRYSITEARVLFEVAQGVFDVADVRRELGIDAGYMSRITAKLERDGLITRSRSDADARRQVLQLTDRGREEFAELDRRSAQQVSGMLVDVPERDRRRLVEAMRTIQAILAPASPATRTVVIRAPAAGDYGWIVARHGALYAAEYGWDERFEGLVARIVADYVAQHDPKRDAAWIAEVDGEPAGCIVCVAKDAEVAQLRILLVEPSARGLGIGSRLVDECLRFAKRAGYREITLWTNDVLVSARRIYEAAGFRLVAEEPHHSFGKDLVGQFWTRSL